MSKSFDVVTKMSRDNTSDKEYESKKIESSYDSAIRSAVMKTAGICKRFDGATPIVITVENPRSGFSIKTIISETDANISEAASSHQNEQ